MKCTMPKAWMVTLVIILLYCNIGIQGMNRNLLNGEQSEGRNHFHIDNNNTGRSNYNRSLSIIRKETEMSTSNHENSAKIGSQHTYQDKMESFSPGEFEIIKVNVVAKSSPAELENIRTLSNEIYPVGAKVNVVEVKKFQTTQNKFAGKLENGSWIVLRDVYGDRVKALENFKTFDLAENFESHGQPLRLKKTDHVLVELENPVNDLLKTLLVFANPEKYTKPIWTNEIIKIKVEDYLDLQKHTKKKNTENQITKSVPTAQLEKLREDGKSIWTDGMKYIIQLFPDIFDINVVLYGIDRIILNTYWKNENECTSFIILDGNTTFYPVREIDDLKSEFATSNVDFDHITFSQFTVNTEFTSTNNYLFNKEDYLDLQRAISASPYYNPYKDYREKIPKNRNTLKLIKEKIKEYLTMPEEDREAQEITTYVQSLKSDIKDKHGPIDLPADLQLGDHNIYGLANCFDLYIKDWTKFDNVSFEKIMENCRTFKMDEDGIFIRNEKLTAEQLINFYYWHNHKLRMEHKDIKKYVEARKTMTLRSALATFVFVVVPCLSSWKSTYMSQHPGENMYDIKLGHYPIALFAYWSIYLFIYLAFKNPFLQHDIEKVNAIEVEDIPANCISKKLLSSYGTGNCVDNVLFLRPLRNLVAKANHYVNAWLNARNLGSLVVVMFIVTTISYACLIPIRDVFGLTRIIPPKFPFYEEFFHAPYELGKVFFLVFGGKSIGFGLPNIQDVDSAGEFMSMTVEFLTKKMIVIMLLTPAMACARLLRVLFIAFGTAIGNYRCCRPLVKEFENWFHTKYNHEQDPCEYFQNNWQPIFSKLGVAAGFYVFKNVFTIKWIQEDITGFISISLGLMIWDFVKYTTNMFNHQIHTISENMLPRDEKLCIVKRVGNSIKYYRAQLFIMVFTLTILLFYVHFGLDAVFDIEFVLELVAEFLGYYMWVFLANNVYLLYEKISSRFANYLYDNEYDNDN